GAAKGGEQMWGRLEQAEGGRGIVRGSVVEGRPRNRVEVLVGGRGRRVRRKSSRAWGGQQTGGGCVAGAVGRPVRR
ncbi:hypothetical protein KI387_007154, partial [Taxus chinensis]